MTFKIKYTILATLLSLIGITHVAFGNTETSVQNNIKLDSLIKGQAASGFLKDSTDYKNSEYELSSIIGFSLAAILSWAFYIFRVLAQLQILFNPILLGIVGLTFSIIALARIKKNKRKGKKLAKAGIILNILHALGIASFVVLLMIAFSGH